MGKLATGRRRGSSRLQNSGKKKQGENKIVPRTKLPITKGDEDEVEFNDDGYEVEEELPAEEKGSNRRYDEVDVYEYELPEDFEDEEVDEDNAFTEEDRLKFPGLAGSGSEQENEEQDEDDKGIDLNSDVEEDAEEGSEEAEDEEEEEEEGEEFVDGNKRESRKEYNEDDEDEEEDNEEEEDEEHEKYDSLMADIAKENLKIRSGSNKPSKRIVVSEAYPESEFNLNPNSSFQGSGQEDPLTVDDLLGSLVDVGEGQKVGGGKIAALKKRIEKQRKSGGAVSAPLPTTVKERLDRKAGYEMTAEDVSKWQPIVKQNREAPTLDLTAQGQLATGPKSSAELASRWRPENDLELQVAEILKESGVGLESKVEEQEGLVLNKLTVEEVLARRDRLSRLRALLFRSELKSKRLKKIKSKTFRRLAAKSERRKREKLGLDPDQEKEEAIKREFLRAQERMTLRHKNSTRWAKNILQKGLTGKAKPGSEGTRAAIAEQIRTHQELTRKVNFQAEKSDSDSEEEEGEEEGEEDGGEPGSEGERGGLILSGRVGESGRRAVQREMEKDEKDDEENEGKSKKDRLFALPFMARAIERKKREAEEEAMAVLREIEEYGADEGGEEGAEEATGGRLRFGGGTERTQRSTKESEEEDGDLALQDDSEEEKDESEDEDGHEYDRSNDGGSGGGGIKGRVQAEDLEGVQGFEMPEKGLLLQKKGSVVTGEVPGKLLSAEAGPEAAGKLPDNHLSLFEPPSSTNRSLTAGKKAEKAKFAGEKLATNAERTQNRKQSSSVGKVEEPADVSEEEVEKQEDPVKALLQGSGSKSGDFSQQEIVRAAFFGDDVESEFLAGKKAAIEAEIGEKLGEGLGRGSGSTVSLPGWGQWESVQKKKGLPDWLKKERQKEEQKKAHAEKGRKDFGKKFLVLSERVDKKAAKFFHPKVPFPFSGKDAFEQSLRTPIGPEYNTDQAFRNMIRPSVLKKTGKIIEPISYQQSSVPETKKKRSKSGGEKRESGERNGQKVKRSKTFKVGKD